MQGMSKYPTSLNMLRVLAVDEQTTVTAVEVEEAEIPCATVTTKTTQISMTAGDMDLEEVGVHVETVMIVAVTCMVGAWKIETRSIAVLNRN